MPDSIHVRLVGGAQVKKNLELAKIKLTEGAKIGLKEGAIKIETDAKSIVPVRTGHLKAHISHEFEDRKDFFSAKVGVRGIRNKDGVMADHYGKYVEFGSNPHVIVPRRAKVLVFQVGGQTVFTKRVNHPGSKARPFLYPAYLKNEAWIIERIRQRAMPKI